MLKKKLYLHNLTAESTTGEKEPSFVMDLECKNNFIHSRSLFNTCNLYKYTGMLTKASCPLRTTVYRQIRQLNCSTVARYYIKFLFIIVEFIIIFIVLLQFTKLNQLYKCLMIYYIYRLVGLGRFNRPTQWTKLYFHICI